MPRVKPIASTCAYCNTDFLNKGFYLRLCCNRTCATKYRLKKQGDRPPWTDAEADLLERLSGLYPAQEIAKQYNLRCNKNNGFSKRSHDAVQVKSDPSNPLSDRLKRSH